MQTEPIDIVESLEIKSMIEIQRNLTTVIGHRTNADTQRKAYNFQRKDKESLRKQILIEVDFKQKIVIGLSPKQINKEYYNQEVRTCLGKNIFN